MTDVALDNPERNRFIEYRGGKPGLPHMMMCPVDVPVRSLVKLTGRKTRITIEVLDDDRSN